MLCFCHSLSSSASRWPDERQRALHLSGARRRGEVPQRRRDLQPLQLQQPALPPLPAALQPLRRHAVRPQPPAGRLPEQPLPQPPAARPAGAHGGVLPGPARLQVAERTQIVTVKLQKLVVCVCVSQTNLSTLHVCILFQPCLVQIYPAEAGAGHSRREADGVWRDPASGIPTDD